MADEGEALALDSEVTQEMKPGRPAPVISRASTLCVYDSRVRQSMGALEAVLRQYREVPRSGGVTVEAYQEIKRELAEEDLSTWQNVWQPVFSMFLYLGNRVQRKRVPYAAVRDRRKNRLIYEKMQSNCRTAIRLAKEKADVAGKRNGKLHEYHVTCTREMNNLDTLGNILRDESERLCRQIEFGRQQIQRNLDEMVTQLGDGRIQVKLDYIHTYFSGHQPEPHETIDDFKFRVAHAINEMETKVTNNAHDVRVIESQQDAYRGARDFLAEQYNDSEVELTVATKCYAIIHALAVERMEMYARKYLDWNVVDLPQLAEGLSEGLGSLLTGDGGTASAQQLLEGDPLEPVLKDLRRRLDVRQEVRKELVQMYDPWKRLEAAEDAELVGDDHALPGRVGRGGDTGSEGS